MGNYLGKLDDEKDNHLVLHATRRFARESDACLYFDSHAGILHHDFSARTLTYNRLPNLLTRITGKTRRECRPDTTVLKEDGRNVHFEAVVFGRLPRPTSEATPPAHG